jgi:hypothetical protein
VGFVMALRKDFQLHVDTMNRHILNAGDESEAFQAICTAFIVLAHEHNVDPHDWVTFTENIRAETAAKLVTEH